MATGPFRLVICQPWLGLNVKNISCMPQKQLQFDKDISVHKFTKHAQQDDLQKKEEASALIGNAVSTYHVPSYIADAGRILLNYGSGST